MTSGIVSGRGSGRDEFGRDGIRLPRGRLLCSREFGRPLNRDDYRPSEQSKQVQLLRAGTRVGGRSNAVDVKVLVWICFGRPGIKLRRTA
jgi:hypothetical protein